ARDDMYDDYFAISSTMERSSLENNQEFTSPQTLVLVGRKGNGKSATGNTILGAESTHTFRSERSSSGVTTTCELIETKLEEGQMLNVIDTPGLADSCSENELIVDEIISCMNKDGGRIHVFLLVFSVRSRFSKEEEAAISSLVTFFGEKVYEYMIVVFTGGDILDKDDETLEGFLDDCPKTLKETFSMCENRFVLFDNKTKDKNKKSDQVKKLVSFVNTVSLKNAGKPYTNEMFNEQKEQRKKLPILEESKWNTGQDISELPNEMHGGHLNRIIEMVVDSSLKETTLSLERQLEEERVARAKAEEDAKAAKQKLDEEKRCVIVEIGKLHEESRKRTWLRRICPIL
ncbi:putative AIG1-type guanine nucleotide-binding (G) domain-containing protein, partial [Tanacetum coccineum]